MHPDVTHGDAIRDRDRAELHRIPTGGVHAFLAGLGQSSQGQVARGDLVPRRSDPDLRLAEVVGAHADGAQHAPGGGAFDTVGDVAAAGFEVWRVHAVLLLRSVGSLIDHVTMPRTGD